MHTQTPQPATPNGYTAPRPTPAPRPIQQAAPAHAAPVAPPASPYPVVAPQPVQPQHMAPGYQSSPAAPAPMAPPMVPQPPQAMPVAVTVPSMDEHREDGDRMLPGIAIHVFCERNETGSVINKAQHDWRMKRVNVDIFMGGLNAAVDYYHNETTPNLIMIETALSGGELFTQLEQLASVCDEGTQVIVIGAANDIRLYRQLMEKGVSDYLVPVSYTHLTLPTILLV